MEVVGIIVIVIIALLLFSFLGWGLKIFGSVFEFLGKGCSTSFGCLFWVLVAIVFLIGLAA